MKLKKRFQFWGVV